MGAFVMYVSVDPHRDQEISVEKPGRHGVSSNALTSSSVMSRTPAEVGKVDSDEEPTC